MWPPRPRDSFTPSFTVGYYLAPLAKIRKDQRYGSFEELVIHDTYKQKVTLWVSGFEFPVSILEFRVSNSNGASSYMKIQLR